MSATTLKDLKTYKTKGSNLGGEGGGRSDFTSDTSHAHDGDLIGVEFRRHGV